jgi:hypothetical protein
MFAMVGRYLGMMLSTILMNCIMGADVKWKGWSRGETPPRVQKRRKSPSFGLAFSHGRSANRTAYLRVEESV